MEYHDISSHSCTKETMAHISFPQKFYTIKTVKSVVEEYPSRVIGCISPFLCSYRVY